jgi:hypothetical protein
LQNWSAPLQQTLQTLLVLCPPFVFLTVDLLTGALSANLVAVAVGPGDNSKFKNFTKKSLKTGSRDIIQIFGQEYLVISLNKILY